MIALPRPDPSDRRLPGGGYASSDLADTPWTDTLSQRTRPVSSASRDSDRLASGRPSQVSWTRPSKVRRSHSLTVTEAVITPPSPG
jgi:hypothetical protein